MSHHEHNELRRERDLAVAVCKGLARYAGVPVEALGDYSLREIGHIADAAKEVVEKVEGKK
jgi:hypothetical protein